MPCIESCRTINGTENLLAFRSNFSPPRPIPFSCSVELSELDLLVADSDSPYTLFILPPPFCSVSLCFPDPCSCSGTKDPFVPLTLHGKPRLPALWNLFVPVKYDVRKMRGRSAGAEATVRAVVASTSPQSATSNLVPSFSPYDRRIQEQATLRSAIAKRNWCQIYSWGGGSTPNANFLRKLMWRFRNIQKGRIRQIKSVEMSSTDVIRRNA